MPGLAHVLRVSSKRFLAPDMTPWERAKTALSLLAIDPQGLGGIAVRSRASPARDAFMDSSRTLDTHPVRLHPALTTDTLDGAIDLAATLEGGTLVRHRGLLDQPDRLFVLSMAERADPYLAARLSMALDGRELSGLIALDEGIDADEHLPETLSDRLAFEVNFESLSMSDTPAFVIPEKRETPKAVDIPTDLPEQLVVLAVQLGISSLRAPSFALHAAKAHAALFGRHRVCSDDVAVAVELIYAHRATQIPETDEIPPQEPETPDDLPPQEQNFDDLTLPSDILLDAVLAALPDGVLDQLRASKTKAGRGAGSGKKTVGNRKGRPLPARDCVAKSGARIDLMATLRAAVPWQTLRKAAQPDRTGPIVRPSDLRSKRYEELSDRLLVFAVDASGSAAAARLGEAKGAVELLLAEAYSRRDHVALIAFRGTDAEILLPPTRSLVQTKRRLAALPGGGGTPLASGLRAALAMSEVARKKGQTPTIVVLTDGRSNIALDGTPNRKAAAADAQHLGAQIGLQHIDSIVIDTGNRPEQSLKSLSQAMNGHYVALPRADAKRLSDAVSASLKA